MVIGVSLVWMGTDGRLSLPPAGTEHDGEREEAAQGLEGDFGLEPGQGGAEAVMDAVAEAEVRPVVAAPHLADRGLEELEILGVAEPAREPVGDRLGAGPLHRARGQQGAEPDAGGERAT